MDRLQESSFIGHSMLPAYERRIKYAVELVGRALNLSNNPYIAFSTGKDSAVMADMVWQLDPNIPAVYFDADACFPESKALLDRMSKVRNIIIWKTEPILDTMDKVGGPTSSKSEAATMRSTVYKPIKSLLEEYDFDLAFVGLREEESNGRKIANAIHDSLFYSKRDGIMVCWPIVKLTFRDVWAYIISNNVDYSAVYDKQFEMGLDWEDCRLSYCYGETKAALGRWAILARGWPEIFNKFTQRFPVVRRYI